MGRMREDPTSGGKSRVLVRCACPIFNTFKAHLLPKREQSGNSTHVREARRIAPEKEGQSGNVAAVSDTTR